MGRDGLREHRFTADVKWQLDLTTASRGRTGTEELCHRPVTTFSHDTLKAWGDTQTNAINE